MNLKYLASTWNEEFTLPDGSYSVSDIQDYFEYDEIIVWFTDQNSKPLEIEDRINLTMVIK